MTITYESRWRSVALRVLAPLALLAAAGAWYGLDGGVLSPSPTAPAPGVWGTTDAARSGPAQESPFDNSARGVLPGDVNGHWVGSIEVGAGTRLPFSFDLRAAEGTLSGTARFPVGEARVEDGKVVGGLLSFTTHHTMPASRQLLTTQFVGELADGVLRLTMSSEGVASHLTLYRDPG